MNTEEHEWKIYPEEIPLLEKMREFLNGWVKLCNDLGIPAANPDYEGISYWEYIKRELALKKMRELEEKKNSNDTGSENQSGSQENS